MKGAFLVSGVRWLCLWGVLFLMAGCVSTPEPAESSLVRQQSATIASLQDEVLRLNQELDGTAGGWEHLRSVSPKIEKAFTSEIVRGDVGIVLERRGLVLTVQDHLLFDPDGTQFKSSGEEILGKIAAFLAADLSKYRVIVEGHTDDQPVENVDGVTNWEYSIGRATAVLHYLVEIQALPPAMFGVAGYAEYRPVTSNATEEGRNRNRRVEIVITTQGISDATER
jgi:chemotaxis protein MotB